MPKPRWKQKIQ